MNHAGDSLGNRGEHDVVLIAVTGWGQADDKRRSREAGFDHHHLIKPIDPAELTHLLAPLAAERVGSSPPHASG